MLRHQVALPDRTSGLQEEQVPSTNTPVVNMLRHQVALPDRTSGLQEEQVPSTNTPVANMQKTGFEANLVQKIRKPTGASQHHFGTVKILEQSSQ